MESHNKKLKVSISGMHCKSCELLVEDGLKVIAGVKKASVDHRRGTAEIEYEGGELSAEAIERAVRSAGYSVGVDKKRPLVSQRSGDYYELLMAAGVLFILYVVLRTLGILDLNLRFSSTPSLAIVLLIGLTAGISTCMALVGGLVLGISARHAALHPEASRIQKFKPHLFFNLGRLLSFAVLGGLVGALGSAFQLSSPVLGILIALVGVVMFMLGLKLTGIFPRLEGKGLMLPKWISRMFGLRTEVKEYDHRGAFITGVLTFFLPCGFTQAMQLYAISTGSFVSGAAIMSAFALGTMPGLLGIGGITSALKGVWGRQFFKLIGLVVVILGLMNVRNGYNLTGITINLPGVGEQLQADGVVTGGAQIVRMEQVAAGYYPNQFTIKRGVPVRWIINSTNSYTCASSLVVPSLGISKRLVSGENVIEFTPTTAGPLKFSCSMGMFTGLFNVVN